MRPLLLQLLSHFNGTEGICGFLAFMTKKNYEKDDSNIFQNQAQLAIMLDEFESGIESRKIAELKEYSEQVQIVLNACKYISENSFDDNDFKSIAEFSNTFFKQNPIKCNREGVLSEFKISARHKRITHGIGISIDNMRKILENNKLSFKKLLITRNDNELKVEIGMDTVTVLKSENCVFTEFDNKGLGVLKDCIVGVAPEISYSDNGERRLINLNINNHDNLTHWIYIDRNGKLFSWGKQFSIKEFFIHKGDFAQRIQKEFISSDLYLDYSSLTSTSKFLTLGSQFNILTVFKFSKPLLTSGIYTKHIKCNCENKDTLNNIPVSVIGYNFRGDKKIIVKQDGEIKTEIDYKKISMKNFSQTIGTFRETIGRVADYNKEGVYKLEAIVNNEEDKAECSLQIINCTKESSNSTSSAIIQSFNGTSPDDLGQINSDITTGNFEVRSCLEISQSDLTNYLNNDNDNRNRTHMCCYGNSYSLITKNKNNRRLLEESNGAGIIYNKINKHDLIIIGNKDVFFNSLRKLKTQGNHNHVLINRLDNGNFMLYFDNNLDRINFETETGLLQTEGISELVYSEDRIPLKNQPFGLKIYPGNFFYDPISKRKLILQNDRNFVLYDVSDEKKEKVLWSSETSGYMVPKSHYYVKNTASDIQVYPFYIQITNSKIELIDDWKLIDYKQEFKTDQSMNFFSVGFRANGAFLYSSMNGQTVELMDKLGGGKYF